MIWSISGYDVLLDDEDYDRLKGFKYYVHKRIADKYGRYYFARHICTEGKKTLTTLHRDVMGCTNGDGKTVDHVYGDTLDNRRENLRFSTVAENSRNQKINKVNTSGIKGVSWHKRIRKWQAQIKISGKKICLGYYADIKDAEKAYAEGSAKYHGEFGRVK